MLEHSGEGVEPHDRQRAEGELHVHAACGAQVLEVEEQTSDVRVNANLPAGPSRVLPEGENVEVYCELIMSDTLTRLYVSVGS